MFWELRLSAFFRNDLASIAPKTWLCPLYVKTAMFQPVTTSDSSKRRLLHLRLLEAF